MKQWNYGIPRQIYYLKRLWDAGQARVLYKEHKGQEEKLQSGLMSSRIWIVIQRFQLLSWSK